MMGLSSRVSRTFSSPSAARRTVRPVANGMNGFFTFTREWNVKNCSHSSGCGNHDHTPSSQ